MLPYIPRLLIRDGGNQEENGNLATGPLSHSPLSSCISESADSATAGGSVSLPRTKMAAGAAAMSPLRQNSDQQAQSHRSGASDQEPR